MLRSRMSRRLALVSVLAATAVGQAAAVVPPRRAMDFPGGPYFVVVCGFSHRSNDDPIVYPGQPGRSHNHTFIGNRTTDAASTPASLRGAATTCGIRADNSAYWVPTLYEQGRPVRPLAAIVYYVKLTAGPVQTLPAGLKMIAGDAMARRAQNLRVTSWSCGLDGARRSSTIPNCGEEALLHLFVKFPDCWDGTRLDSVDHKRHMAYSTAGRCPSSHPVAVPAISLVVLYPVDARAELSSGRFSGHADFVNAWDQDVLARLVERLN